MSLPRIVLEDGKIYLKAMVKGDDLVCELLITRAWSLVFDLLKALRP